MTPPAGKKRLVLLDAHAIIHRAYHALPDFMSSKGQPTGALYGLSAMLIKIIADLKPDYLIAAYDLPKPTYRHEAYKDYKAGRPRADEALIAQLKKSRDIFTAFGIPIYDKEGFEADDILGTIVEEVKGRLPAEALAQAGKSKVKSSDIEIIIASGDMDTLQLIRDGVRVFTFRKGMSDTVMYDTAAVLNRYGFPPERIPDYKGLSGDPSDNIVGVPGVGEKTATTLIKNLGSIEDIYAALRRDKNAVEKAGLKPRVAELLLKNKDEAEFSKMLATIRRDAPITFALPEKTWRESVDLNRANALFSELEFRALPERLRAAIEGRETKKNSAGGTVPKRPAEGGEGESEPKQGYQMSLTSLSLAEIPPVEVKETSVALWLVNSNWTNPTREDIYNFARTRDWETAKKSVFAELARRKLTKVYEEIERPLIPVLERMERWGVRIDAPYLAALSNEYHESLRGIEQKIWKLAGQEFNVASPKQLGDILFNKLGLKAARQKKTPTGALSTKESELEKLRDASSVVPLVLEYRELAKLLGTYIDTIPTLLDKNSRLHSHFIQTGTTTGRIASQEPNLQNIPIKSELGKKIRHAFVAEKDFFLAAFDYSQIELRIAAFMSGDSKLIRIFEEGSDVHAAVAALVFGVPLEKVTHEMRRRAKVINFGILYGMGVNALRANLGASRDEAAQFLADYFKNFSTLARHLDEVKKRAARDGYTETFFGRRRYLEGITSKIPYIRAEAERMAVNAPFQGTQADIIKLAMIRIEALADNEDWGGGVRMLLQVHDELLFEIRDGLVEKVAPQIKEVMESVISPKDIRGVKIIANASVGKNWGSMKPWGEREFGK